MCGSLSTKREILTSQSTTAPQNDKTQYVILNEVKNLVMVDKTCRPRTSFTTRFFTTRCSVQNDITVEIVSKALYANFSSKAVSCNFFVKPDGQSEVYFDFAAARKSA